MERLAAHLQECEVCGGMCAELQSRAEWVTAVLGALPVQEPVLRMPRLPRKSPAVSRWTGAAITLAASLVLALVLLPKGMEKRIVVVPPTQSLPLFRLRSCPRP